MTYRDLEGEMAGQITRNSESEFHEPPRPRVYFQKFRASQTGLQCLTCLQCLIMQRALWNVLPPLRCYFKYRIYNLQYLGPY